MKPYVLCPVHTKELSRPDCTPEFTGCEFREARKVDILRTSPAWTHLAQLLQEAGPDGGPVNPQAVLAAKLEQLNILEGLDHGWLHEEGATAIVLPFGFEPTLKWETVDYKNPKGLMVPGKVHGDQTYGIAAHELAEQILAHYGLVRNPQIEGRGSRLRDAIAKLRQFITLTEALPFGAGKARWEVPPDRWHYTHGVAWERIQRDGLIKLASSGVPKKERKAAWFSTRTDWEPTATKGSVLANQIEKLNPKTGEAQLDVKKLTDEGIVKMTFDEMRRDLRGMFRIGVTGEAAPYSWADFVRLSGIDKLMAVSLEHTGRESGSDPHDWYCNFEPVPKTLWRSVEVLYNGKWEPVEW